MSIKLVEGDVEILFEDVPTLDDAGNEITVEFEALVEYKAEINDRENYDYLDWSLRIIRLKSIRNDEGFDLELTLTDKLREKLETFVWHSTLRVEEDIWSAIEDSLW